ncbi:MAG: hypothetical protein D6732_11090 [Methanobacteriota archaeon]|nr:MAG: hypothetical protein D6732_11090 [Euryarchaeota archaeon]
MDDCGTPPKPATFSILIGSLPATTPYNQTSYAQQAEESTCFNCSAEPELPSGAAEVAAAFDLGNFVGAWILDYKSVYDQPEIFVFLNGELFPDGHIEVDELEIHNQTNLNLSVSDVSFTVSGSPSCKSPCIYGGVTGTYNINSGPSIQPKDGFFGLGTVQANSVGFVNLSPPGVENKPNYFYSYNHVQVKVLIVNTDTGQRWRPIMFPIK